MKPRRILALLSIVSLLLSGPEAYAVSQTTQVEPCTVLELLPGYPGYRGYLTGLVTQPDQVCLEVLRRDNPSFDLIISNAEIDRAAARLMVHGLRTEWTWETWMAIDVEMGNTPPCYSCLWVMGGAPSQSLEPPAAQDARIQLGRFGERNIALRFAQDNGIQISAVSGAPTDDQLRAIIGMANPGRYLTAEEVLETAIAFLESYYCTGQQPCGGLDGGILASLSIQGGYAPTPAGARDEDQGFMVLQGNFTVAEHGMNPMAGNALVERAYGAFEEWRALSFPRPLFAEWLAQQGVIP